MKGSRFPRIDRYVSAGFADNVANICFLNTLYCYCIVVRLLLYRKGTQGMVWSEDTIRKALQLKFACGKTGYQLLIEQGHPVPCTQTLQRKMRNISFQSGILPWSKSKNFEQISFSSVAHSMC